MTNNMRAIHPGEILRDELEFLGLSANQFAQRCLSFNISNKLIFSVSLNPT
jgi:plasmid maintenance system antidote protein VapI